VRARITSRYEVLYRVHLLCGQSTPIGGYLRAPVVPRALAVGLMPLPASCSSSGSFRLPYRSCGEVVAQPLCPGLADVELRTDRADGRNAIRCQLISEHFDCLPTERVRNARAAGYAIR
jgi:hypothetical protein